MVVCAADVAPGDVASDNDRPGKHPTAARWTPWTSCHGDAHEPWTSLRLVLRGYCSGFGVISAIRRGGVGRNYRAFLPQMFIVFLFHESPSVEGRGATFNTSTPSIPSSHHSVLTIASMDRQANTDRVAAPLRGVFGVFALSPGLRPGESRRPDHNKNTTLGVDVLDLIP